MPREAVHEAKIRIKLHDDLFTQVMAMYEKFYPEDRVHAPCHLTSREKAYRVHAMLEELGEYVSADTLHDQLDALVDLTVFCLGTAVRHGFYRFNEAFRRVMLANLSKIPGPAAAGKRGGFAKDLLKPPGWEAPDLLDLCVNPKTQVEDSRLTRDEIVMVMDEIYGAPPPVELGTSEVVLEMLTVENMHPSLREAAELIFRKSQDYGDPDPTKEIFHPLGHASYFQMLHTKLLRIRNLGVDSDGRSPNFESLRDSVIDLINYAAFYAAWLDRREKDGDA